MREGEKGGGREEEKRVSEGGREGGRKEGRGHGSKGPR